MMVAGRRTLVAFLATLCFFLYGADRAQAGTLSSATDYLGRQKANIVNGETHQVFFTPATTLAGTGNTLSLTFPDADDGQWCRTAGSDLTVVGMTDPEGVALGATALPGALTADCTQGSGSASSDTIIVSGIDPLTSGTLYGVEISDGTTAILGTAASASSVVVTMATTDGVTTIDSLTFQLTLIANDRVSITAVVADNTPPTPTNPTVVFSGYAAPSGVITFVRDGTTVGTTTADSSAKFSMTLANQPTGSVVYEVQGTDADGQSLSSVTFALTLSLNTTTVISGVFLGPSIGVDKTGVKIGTPVTVFGTTAPNSTVTLDVHSVQAKSYDLTADSLGQWSKTLDTVALGIGSHTAQAQSVLGGSTVSELSDQVSFAVNPLGACDGKAPADLNCDGQVNITDFSILLYFWRQTHPANSRTDINQDGVVDLIDFSIMLYQWTA